MNGLNICPKCLVVIGQYGQCNCNSRRPAWTSLLRFLRLLAVLTVLTIGMYGSVQAEAMAEPSDPAFGEELGYAGL